MSIKIYSDLGSGSYRRVAVAAKVMGVDYERVNVDLFKGESHTPEFLQLNPHGLTPVLQEGDTVEMEITCLGKLSNTITREEDDFSILARKKK